MLRDGRAEQGGRAGEVRDRLVLEAEEANDVDHAGDARERTGADPDPAGKLNAHDGDPCRYRQTSSVERPAFAGMKGRNLEVPAPTPHTLTTRPTRNPRAASARRAAA